MIIVAVDFYLDTLERFYDKLVNSKHKWIDEISEYVRLATTNPNFGLSQKDLTLEEEMDAYFEAYNEERERRGLK
jgi:hypothetical protein